MSKAKHPNNGIEDIDLAYILSMTSKPPTDNRILIWKQETLVE